MLHVRLMPPVLAGSGNEILHPGRGSNRVADGFAGGHLVRLSVLTPLEQNVLAMSHRDGRSSLRPRSWIWRIVFGAPTLLSLANPRLEALRRYAILFRCHVDAVSSDERTRLTEAGFDDAQRLEIEAIVRSRLPVHRAHRDPRAAPVIPQPAELGGHCVESDPVNMSVSLRPQYFAFMGAVSLALGSTGAHAQNTAGIQQPVPDHVTADSDTASDNGRDHFILGLGASYAPAYQGADTYRAFPIPAIDVAWGPFFANLRNGIGVNALDTKAVTLGVSATYMPGYRAKDVPNGVGKLNVGLGARAFANVRAAGFVATVGATKGVLGDNKGVVADASLSYPVRVTSRLTLIPTAGTTWSDGKYNNRYFGIDPQQALASGLPQFRTGSGFKDASLLLTANYRLTQHLMLGVSGGATTLLGDVKNSPLVVHRTQPSGFVSMAYRF